MSYGVDTDAIALYNSLTADSDIEIPDVDLSGPEYQIPGGIDSDAYQAISRLTNADMTNGAIDGTGTFDVMMQGMKAQLKEEFDKGRITGAEYTKSYIALTQSTMQFAVQYLLGRDQAYWQAVTAQAQAVTARVALETAKLQAATIRLEVENSKATVALTKAKIASEDVTYAQGKFQVDNILPLQQQLLVTQNAGALNQNQVTIKQITLVAEQTEAARAQTLDVRTDLVPITGSVGMQKQLYQQQIASYKSDAKVKVGKIFSDAWITMKTVDDALEAPNGFTNTSLDAVLSGLKNDVSLN